MVIVIAYPVLGNQTVQMKKLVVTLKEDHVTLAEGLVGLQRPETCPKCTDATSLILNLAVTGTIVTSEEVKICQQHRRQAYIPYPSNETLARKFMENGEAESLLNRAREAYGISRLG